MTTNPIKLTPKSVPQTFMDWCTMSSKPYSAKSVEPFTKLRIILATGAEFEAVNFMHRFSRSCPDNDLRREIALIRRGEQQQQKRLSALKPIEETILETTIAYEQLAVELTAVLAQNEPDKYVKKALDFALLEDFDHLYRYANLLEMDTGKKADKMVGRLTEIMPGRPTISEHRYPIDDVKRFCNFTKANILTKLNTNIITAAEQQTMNYYMNVGAFYGNKLGRDLYTEIAMIEEQHVTQYESLLDTTCTWLDNLVMHEYTECYLYFSLLTDETNKYVKAIFEDCFEQEVAHLHKAVELLRKYEKKEYQQVVGNGDFPKLLAFSSNIDYVRNIIANTVQNTAHGEEYVQVDKLDKESNFYHYQQTVNDKVKAVPSHAVISKYVEEKEKDYRYQTEKHPIPPLQDRTEDNTCVGRSICC